MPKDWKEKIDSNIIKYVGGIRIKNFVTTTTEEAMSDVKMVLEEINKCSNFKYTSLNINSQSNSSLILVMKQLDKLEHLTLSWQSDKQWQNWTQFFSKILYNENVQLKSLTLYEDPGIYRKNQLDEKILINALISIEEINIQRLGHMMPKLIQTIAATSQDKLKIKRLSSCWCWNKGKRAHMANKLLLNFIAEIY